VRTVLGFEQGGRDGTKAVDTVHPADQDAAKAAFAHVMADPAAVARLQCRARHADGGYRWVDLSVSNLLGNDAVRGIVVNARDITDSRRLQEQMSHQALHDALTGLPNRRMFYDRLEHSTERRRRGGSEDLALVFVDLDGFKPVNDTLGHDAGDELLRQVSHRFKACLRTGDTLARVGGDEFAVLLDELAGPEDAVAVADRIVASLHAPFAIHGQNVWIGASVGVAPIEAGSDPHQAMRAADTAMYRAKQAGGHRFVLHGPDGRSHYGTDARPHHAPGSRALAAPDRRSKHAAVEGRSEHTVDGRGPAGPAESQGLAAPGVSAPEVGAPGVSAPEVGAPGLSAPEVSAGR
jgi:diguanylate cyclase (GGDEF)-like protein/PAS domain S-box-containing protein